MWNSRGRNEQKNEEGSRAEEGEKKEVVSLANTKQEEKKGGTEIGICQGSRKGATGTLKSELHSLVDA